MATSTATKISLLSPKDAAKRMRLSESTLAKWRMTGEGPAFVKIGARIAYDESMIDAWLAARIRTSTSDTGRW